METRLMPCPFCGGAPTAIETHPGRGELYCGNCDVVLGGDNAMTTDELTAAWNTRAELGSDARYDAGFASGVLAVFQQLEGIEDYEGLQDLIADYWYEGEGNDER